MATWNLSATVHNQSPTVAQLCRGRASGEVRDCESLKKTTTKPKRPLLNNRWCRLNYFSRVRGLPFRIRLGRFKKCGL